MALTPEVETKIREVLKHVIGQGFNLSVYPLEHTAIMYSHDIDALVQAISYDVWNLVQVHRSRKLEGTFVLDTESFAAGDKLVCANTRSLDNLFKDAP